MATATKAVQARPPGRLLTPKEASELLGIPDGTLAQWRSQKHGPQYIKLEGRLVRYGPRTWKPICLAISYRLRLTMLMPSARLATMKKSKDPAAVALGKRGGLARARKASKKTLSKIGRKGAAARWKKTRKR